MNSTTMYAVTFFATIFIAALGNAMNKKVYRREVSIASGKDLPEMSKAYKRTAKTLFLVGLSGLVVWFILFTFGNPLTLLANG